MSKLSAIVHAWLSDSDLSQTALKLACIKLVHLIISKNIFLLSQMSKLSAVVLASLSDENLTKIVA